MGFRMASARGMSRMPELPFIIGTSSVIIVRPIMGPPPMILPVSSGMPPAASIRVLIGVPMRAIKFDGFTTLLPVTVMTRSMSGLFFCTAS